MSMSMSMSMNEHENEHDAFQARRDRQRLRDIAEGRGYRTRTNRRHSDVKGGSHSEDPRT